MFVDKKLYNVLKEKLSLRGCYFKCEKIIHVMQLAKKSIEIAIIKQKHYAVLSGAPVRHGTSLAVGRYHADVELNQNSKNNVVKNLDNAFVFVTKENGHWKLVDLKAGKVIHTFSSSAEFPIGTPAYLLDAEEQLDGTKQPQYLIENQVVTYVPRRGIVIDWEKTNIFPKKYFHNPEFRQYLDDCANKYKKALYMDFLPGAKDNNH